MTDIDFRRLASLLFALRLMGVSADPVGDGVAKANQLLEKLQQLE